MMDVDRVTVLGGPVAAADYLHLPEHHRGDVDEFLQGLATLTGNDLQDTTQRLLWEGMFLIPVGDPTALHVKTSALAHEARRRHVAAGHHPTCQGDTVYADAYNALLRREKLPVHPTACSCGHTTRRRASGSASPPSESRC